MRDLDDVLLDGVTHWQHPRYFAYFATSSSEPAILAELLAATLNSVAILWRTAPAATELEGVVLDWVAQLLGLPEGWHGHIEDTASTSTLAALIAARETTGRDVVVVLGSGALVGAEGRADARDADAQWCRATTRFGCGPTRSGICPMPPLSSLPSVRLRRLRSIRWGRWPRRSLRPAAPVTLASGRGCMSMPRTRARRWCARSFGGRSTGVERADSLVVNAHKWMLTPTDCSLLWTRRPDDFRRAFSLVPEYLRTPDAEDALSLSEYGPALGRRFRALKLWAVLRCHGRSGLQAHIRSGVELAAAFESWVRAEPGWEVCAPRPFSVVCFRAPGSDERNRALLERVNASGEIFISHAMLGGRYVLRLAVGQMSTTRADVRACLGGAPSGGRRRRRVRCVTAHREGEGSAGSRVAIASGAIGRKIVSAMRTEPCSTARSIPLPFDAPFFGSTDQRYRSSDELLPSSSRATTSCWICWVPSKMSRILTSRAHFSRSSPSP